MLTGPAQLKKRHLKSFEDRNDGRLVGKSQEANEKEAPSQHLDRELGKKHGMIGYRDGCFNRQCPEFDASTEKRQRKHEGQGGPAGPQKYVAQSSSQN